MRLYDAEGTKAQQRIHRHYAQIAVGDGATTVFHLEHTPADFGDLHVHVDGAIKAPTLNAGTSHDYTWKPGTTQVTFGVAPANGKVILFYMSAI